MLPSLSITSFLFKERVQEKRSILNDIKSSWRRPHTLNKFRRDTRGETKQPKVLWFQDNAWPHVSLVTKAFFHSTSRHNHLNQESAVTDE